MEGRIRNSPFPGVSHRDLGSVRRAGHIFETALGDRVGAMMRML